MEQRAGGETIAQALEQLFALLLLLGTQRGEVPFEAVAVGGGNEGRLAAHGQAHILGAELLVDLRGPAPRSRAIDVRGRAG